MKLPTYCLFFLALGVAMISCESSYPNIVLIVADDLGWNDVGFHGTNQILTPNIDTLAEAGVGLGRYYSCSVCTPSRASLLSGKFAHVLGMQGLPMHMSENRAIPLNVTLLPQYFKKAGYSTSLVGKWHVGDAKEEYLPTERGFDSHFGHRGGYLDYYEYTLEESTGSIINTGFTLYRNKTPAWDVEGYITDVFTDEAKSVIEKHDSSSPLFLMVGHNAPHSGDECAPLQAPAELVRQMRHVESSARRIFAAMMKKLDDSVGEIVKSLNDKGILNNTIIIFIADNGGMTSGRHQNWASNYPLRGTKMSPFEGAVRVTGLIWSSDLNNTDHYWDGYMHVIDWLPTLLGAAGIDIPTDIDGVNQWDNIKSNLESSRNVFFEIDDYTGFASVTYGDYKLITGNVTKTTATYQGGNLLGIIGEPPSHSEAILNSTVYNIFKSFADLDVSNFTVRDKLNLTCANTTSNACTPENSKVCLYNIKDDPCETTDISSSNSELISTMQKLLDAENERKIPRTTLVHDPLAAPRLHNYTWAPWITS